MESHSETTGYIVAQLQCLECLPFCPSLDIDDKVDNSSFFLIRISPKCIW